MHLVSVWPTLTGMKDPSFISASLLRQLLLSWQAWAGVSFPDKQLSEELGRATYRPTYLSEVPHPGWVGLGGREAGPNRVGAAEDVHRRSSGP